MTLDALHAALSAPSAKSWRTIIDVVEQLADDEVAAALDVCADALTHDWPVTLQRTPPPHWIAEGKSAWLALASAPGGVLVELVAGGGGLGHFDITEIVAAAQLDQACLAFVYEAFDALGSARSIAIQGQPFAYAQAVGPPLDLTPFVMARGFAASFPLDAIPRAVARRLDDAFVPRADHNPHTDGPRVPLELAWNDALRLPPTPGTPGWISFVDLVIMRDGAPIYEERGRTLAEQRMHRYFPDDIVHPPERPAPEPVVSAGVVADGHARSEGARRQGGCARRLAGALRHVPIIRHSSSRFARRSR